jgi:HK97 family phage prohead protease
MLIRKTLRLQDVSLKMDGEAGSFAGYASVFGGVDSYGDTIVKGAFQSTLRTRGMPKMFYDHEWNFPIGKWTSAKEDDKGLFVKGELTPGLSRANDVHAALKHGTLDGLSIGGYVMQGDYDTTDTGRVIRKWSALIEISPVVFPADAAAKIDGESVKGADLLEAIGSIESVRDLECFLRDAGGLSKGAAIALVARSKAVLGVEGEPDAKQAEAKALKALSQRIEQLRSAIPA